MIKITTRNIVYFVIIVLLIIITAWYLSASCEGYDNLDDVLSGVSSCTDPNGCKTIDEIKKESEGDLSKQTAELAKPLSSPPNIITKPMTITISNNDESAPIEIPPLPPAVMIPPAPVKPKFHSMAITPTEKMVPLLSVMDLIEKDPIMRANPTKNITNNNTLLLNDADNDVYMLDVDRDEEGVTPGMYNIGSLSVNHPDKELTISTLVEYKTNSSLYDIYTKRHEIYNNIRTKIESMPVIPLSKKYSKGERNQSVSIELDSGKLNNNFIIITPKTNEVFPSNFEISITNNSDLTGVTFELWGDFDMNSMKPQPSGNPNRILDNNILTEYLNHKGDTFGYSKQAFGDSCSIIDENKCMVGGLDIGKRAINIVKSGNVYDDKDNVIGSVSKQNTTATNMNEIFTIRITNSDSISGLVFFFTYML
jgi:hypothetical protein